MSSNEYITEDVINEEVGRILNSIAEKQEFKMFYFEINEAFSKDDGYTGILKSVKIINPNNTSQALGLFMKSSPREKNIKEVLPMTAFFHTEIYMYDTIFPCFKNLEIEKNLIPSTFMPKFFGSLLSDKNEVIVLENLKENGYRLHDKSTPMDTEHIRLVIAACAQFHSLSFALRNQQPKMFEELPSKLCNSFPKLIYGFKNFLIKKYNNLLNVLDENGSKRIGNFLQNFEREFKELLNPHIDEYSVITHGDCWNNNILFKYLDESSSPVEVRLVDYQLTRLSPPVLDLAYFFFACSSEEEMNRCNEYLNFYYKNFSTHLQELGCDPNKLYPYSVFMKQWHKFAKFSVIIVPIVLILMLGTENEIADLQQLTKTGVTFPEAYNRDMQNNEEFNERLKIIISYLVKNNLL